MFLLPRVQRLRFHDGLDGSLWIKYRFLPGYINFKARNFEDVLFIHQSRETFVANATRKSLWFPAGTLSYMALFNSIPYFFLKTFWISSMSTSARLIIIRIKAPLSVVVPFKHLYNVYKRDMTLLYQANVLKWTWSTVTLLLNIRVCVYDLNCL